MWPFLLVGTEAAYLRFPCCLFRCPLNAPGASDLTRERRDCAWAVGCRALSASVRVSGACAHVVPVSICFFGGLETSGCYLRFGVRFRSFSDWCQCGEESVADGLVACKAVSSYALFFFFSNPWDFCALRSVGQ